MRTTLILGLVLLVAAVLATQWFTTPLPLPENATVFETPLALPRFELETSAGSRFTQDDFRNRYSLLFFGFTNCPDICPLTTAALAGAYDALEREARVAPPQVVFVSVDPNRDTPARIEAYLDAFDSRFLGATANRAGLDPLLRALGVTVMTHAVTAGDSYSVTHNGTVYVIGPEASLIATLADNLSAAEIARDFRRIRALHQRASGTQSAT